MRKHNTKTHILVLEDETAIFLLIQFHLTKAGYSVSHANNAQQAWQIISEKSVDLLLCDWMLPDMDGSVFIQKLRASATHKWLPIIMLTAKSTDDDKAVGLTAGADDYLTKPFSPKELIARVAALLRRCAPQKSRAILSVGRLTLDPDTRTVQIGDDEVRLSGAEFRLLHFFVSHQKRTYERGELLDLVWGGAELEIRTVDVHIKRLRKALPIDCIQTVRGLGYRFDDSGLHG